MPDKISELYGLVSDKGYFKDEQEFRDFANNAKDKKEIFDLFADDGYFKDRTEFDSYFSESTPQPSGAKKKYTYEYKLFGRWTVWSVTKYSY